MLVKRARLVHVCILVTPYLLQHMTLLILKEGCWQTAFLVSSWCLRELTKLGKVGWKCKLYFLDLVKKTSICVDSLLSPLLLLLLLPAAVYYLWVRVFAVKSVSSRTINLRNRPNNNMQIAGRGKNTNLNIVIHQALYLGLMCSAQCVQCAVCSVQYVVFSLQCAVCIVHCALCIVQCAVCSV